jgi:beta-phosphoglucomutase
MSTALFFDLDGTLADTEPLHWQAWCAALQPLGAKLSWRTYARHAIGRPDTEFCLWLIQQEFGTVMVSDSKELLAAKQRSFTGIASIANAVPESTVRVLRLLGDTPKAVVTSSPMAEAMLVLKSGAIAGAFDTIVCLDDVKAHKPDPEPYRKAMAALGVTSGVAFEDSANGKLSASAAGLRVVGVKNPKVLSKVVLRAIGVRMPNGPLGSSVTVLQTTRPLMTLSPTA